MLFAAVDDVLRAERVDSVKQLPRPPDTGQRRRVEDDVHALARGQDRRLVLQIAGERLDSQRFQLRISLAAEDSDAIAARDKLLDDVPSEESAAACDECSHEGSMPAKFDQTA